MKANEAPQQYIDKAALVAEIKRRRESNAKERYFGRLVEDNYFLDFLDTLEVKEVDLEKELVEEIYSHIDSIKDTADRMTSGNFMHNRAAIKFSANTIAKVLELMGLKAQKGE